MKMGVDYYPEHWERGMWDQDAELMRQTGVRLIRLAEFAWSRLEPEEGRYDFAWLDDAIDVFHQRGIEVVIGTPTNTPPNWLVERHPDVLPVDALLHPRYPGIRGHRCYNSPSMRLYSERIVDKLASHYSKHPAVIGWQIDNEFGLNECHCDHCSERFRQWLKIKYGSLEALNREWGTVVWSGEYSSWSQIKPPLGGATHRNPSYLLDWKRFETDSVVTAAGGSSAEAVSVPFRDPSSQLFIITDSGRSSVDIAGFTKFDDFLKKELDTTADTVYNTFVSKGIPVIVGEYELLGWDATPFKTPFGEVVPEHGEMLKYIEYFTHKVQEKHLTTMLWDNGGRFDRRTLQWDDPELYNLIMASLKSRSSTAESDLIFVRKGAQDQDAVMPLSLNDNVLTSIKVGDYELVEGTDYVLNGEDLTVKASYLAKLTESAELGEVALMKARFNKGADWTFHVMYNDTPVLQNVVGTTDSFAIPTAFGGDRLATMEAVYAAGGNAGPHNWTSLKEYARTYKPSYANNEISLTQGFFNEVNDGTVVLKFHFWSGAIIEYTITKNGTSITGSAL